VALPQARDRFSLSVHAGKSTLRARLARDVRAGLTAVPKRLPCCYFYDEEGSRLFEEICGLPEYYLPAAEREILEEHAGGVASQFRERPVLVELGSGSASKTRLVIDALLRWHRAITYAPIDISQSALELSASALLEAYPALEIHAVAGDYLDELRRPQVPAEPPWPPRLILWLGSSIGNLDRPEAAAFLRRIRDTMDPRDRLLVGIDLRKDRAVVEPAYNDAEGVTARFNLNLLARINRELGGDFDLSAFHHLATYDEDVGRIEMYLRSTRDQAVVIEGLELTVSFGAGEAVHTENSYKYSMEEIDALADASGLAIAAQWTDGARRFSTNLLARE